jgi:hypothetical protein
MVIKQIAAKRLNGITKSLDRPAMNERVDGMLSGDKLGEHGVAHKSTAAGNENAG